MRGKNMQEPKGSVIGAPGAPIKGQYKEHMDAQLAKKKPVKNSAAADRVSATADPATDVSMVDVSINAGSPGSPMQTN